MAWSIKSHPRRLARREAISPPPLPYSREIVMARMRLLRSRSSFMICSSFDSLFSLLSYMLWCLTIYLYYKLPYYLCKEHCELTCQLFNPMMIDMLPIWVGVKSIYHQVSLPMPAKIRDLMHPNFFDLSNNRDPER